jgi:hypothetical protein
VAKKIKLKDIFKPILAVLGQQKKADAEQDAFTEEVVSAFEESAKVNRAVLEHLEKRGAEQEGKMAGWKKRIAAAVSLLLFGVLSGAVLQANFGAQTAANFLTGSSL